MDVTAKWEGFDALLADLGTLRKGMQGAALRSALRVAASPVTKRAKADSPSRRVRKSLAARVSGTGLTARARIGARRRSPGARILHLIEGGTKPHRIAPRKARRLKIGGRYVSGPVQHPGARARPFFKQALPSEAPESRRKFGSALGQIIRKMKLKMLNQRTRR